mgnify:CR=1 FL=1
MPSKCSFEILAMSVWLIETCVSCTGSGASFLMVIGINWSGVMYARQLGFIPGNKPHQYSL